MLVGFIKPQVNDHEAGLGYPPAFLQGPQVWPQTGYADFNIGSFFSSQDGQLCSLSRPHKRQEIEPR